jgi:hypothetical protein
MKLDGRHRGTEASRAAWICEVRREASASRAAGELSGGGELVDAREMVEKAVGSASASTFLKLSQGSTFLLRGERVREVQMAEWSEPPWMVYSMSLSEVTVLPSTRSMAEE